MLQDYYIGELVESKADAALPKADTPAAANSLVTLNPKGRVALKLTERIEVGTNTHTQGLLRDGPSRLQSPNCESLHEGQWLWMQGSCVIVCVVLCKQGSTAK